MDQLFFIGMTMTGFGWNDLLSLTDRDRLALIERCNAHNERQQQEVSSLQARARAR